MAFLPSDEFFCSEHPVAEEAYVQLAVLTKVRKYNQSEFFSIEKPDKLTEGTLQREKHVLVDPVSMKESGKLQPVVTSPKDYGMPPLPLPPGKSSFLSYSLPGSGASSPKFSSHVLKKKPQSQAFNPLARQHSVALSNLAHLRENHMQRSKSCGEGRISAMNDGLDLSLKNANSKRYSNSSRPETRNDQLKNVQNNLDAHEDNFKCGAICLYLPSFGKAKTVRSRKEQPQMLSVISRTVSLEKFECASWTSSAFIHDNEGGNSSKFFDLPLELIQCSDNDKHLPVRAAFVFEKDRKGSTKNSATRRISRKSHESSSQVRFSSSFRGPHQSTTASPCISPRLQKARDDFNAFLKAADN